MSTDSLNDNAVPHIDTGQGSPDPHGHAAMLLVESLIHGLIARSVLSVADAVEIIDIAADVKEDIGASLGDSPQALRKLLAILGAISASLRPDLPRR